MNNENATIRENRPIPQEAFDWYDEYAHGFIDRRTFMARLAGLAATGISMSVLTAALLPNYAEAEQVLKANGADYVAHAYKGVNHGFHNDSTGRYAPEEAELAWSRTVEFFHEHLGG